MTPETWINGYCPMCGKQHLYLQPGGLIVCKSMGEPECPNRVAVTALLSNGETEHIVDLTESGWTIKHPLRERIADDLFSCAFHQRLTNTPGLSLYVRGQYRVSVVHSERGDGGLFWDPLDHVNIIEIQGEDGST